MEWLKFKQYLHIDTPLEYRCKSKIINYVNNPSAIATHAFLPLIRREVISRPLKKKIDDSGLMEKKHKRKVRPITFASHLDSAIYSYYSYLLLNKYEIYLEEKDISDVKISHMYVPYN